MFSYKPELKKIARKLRNNCTKTEREIWGLIRKKQICGVQFYRQRPIKEYVLDFYAPKIRLAIEIDGSQHYQEDAVKKDSLRDKTLKQLGITVIRFNNHEIATQKECVMNKLWNVVEEKMKEKE